MNYRECKILQCEPTDVPGCWYVLAEGALDMGPPLTAFTERVREAINEGARWVIFDTRKITSFLDLGHGALVNLSDALQQAGGGAILLQLNARERMIFQMLKIESMFHFAETMDEALAIARGAAPR